jgi:protein involved in polysaccharide export with SLBB domain
MDRRRFLLTSLVGMLSVPIVAACGGDEPYIYVEGEVRRPGGVQYTKGMTLGQGIAQAGGLAATASARDVELIRGGKFMKVNVYSIPVDPPPADVELRPEDVIRVHIRWN